MMQRNGGWLLLVLALGSAVAGWFVRTPGQSMNVPLFMPLLALGSVLTLVVLVRLLKPLLYRDRGYYDAD